MVFKTHAQLAEGYSTNRKMLILASICGALWHICILSLWLRATGPVEFWMLIDSTIEKRQKTKAVRLNISCLLFSIMGTKRDIREEKTVQNHYNSKKIVDGKTCSPLETFVEADIPNTCQMCP